MSIRGESAAALQHGQLVPRQRQGKVLASLPASILLLYTMWYYSWFCSPSPSSSPLSPAPPPPPPQESCRRHLQFTVPRVVAVSPQMRLVEDNTSNISLSDIFKQVRDTCCVKRHWIQYTTSVMHSHIIQTATDNHIFALVLQKVRKPLYILPPQCSTVLVRVMTGTALWSTTTSGSLTTRRAERQSRYRLCRTFSHRCRHRWPRPLCSRNGRSRHL